MEARAEAAGTVRIGGDLKVHRLGFGAMRITGADIWGPPRDPAEARRVLKRAVAMGVNFIDTADSYGPGASEGSCDRCARAGIPTVARSTCVWPASRACDACG